MSDRCYYCESENVDHKHGGGHSCGDCCGMHGYICNLDVAAHKWVGDCIKAKNVRIAELEAKLAEANAGLNNLAKRLCLNHAATMCGERNQRNDGKCEICEMQAKMAACEWKPITPEDLPKVGDEVFRRYGDVHSIPREAEGGIWENCADGTWTHFRTINPPRQGKP